MNCTEIVTLIKNHTDHDCEIFICKDAWANEPNGALIGTKIDPDFIIEYFGNIIPKDWTLTYDEATIQIGFIF